MKVKRYNSQNPDFIALVSALDLDLAERDGEEHSFYHQFNSIDGLKHTLVIYNGETPVGCGAIKKFDKESMEIKRMYVIPKFRGKGLASRLLLHLEHWALELGYTCTILETGKRQPEAIALYVKNGYKTIVNYGQYAGITNSICFEKKLNAQENQS